MATDSAALKQQTGMMDGGSARTELSVETFPAQPIMAGVGLDQPFFEDKNRAFWMLQTAGRTGSGG
jgi:two-component system, LytTR family, sensor kinase